MKNYIIKAENLKKSFFRGKNLEEIVRGIDFFVEEGEFVAIVGESGSGKSTLLYLLSGVEKPTEGEVEVLGRNLFEISDKEMARLRREEFSFVYQFDNLVSNLNVYENIILPLSLSKKDLKNEESKIEELFSYLGIENCKNSFPNELSGGEQQRASLARALAINPKLIFLDEPTGSLDAEIGLQVMNLLKDINERFGVTLVMVTHSEAHSKFATRIVKIVDGKVAE